MKKQTAGDSNKRKEVGAGKGENIIRSSIPFFAQFRSKTYFASRALELNEKRKTSVDRLIVPFIFI